MLQIYPLEFRPSPNGSLPQPRDPLLFEAVQKFCKEELDSEYQYCYDIKTWIVAEHGEDGYAVYGVTSLRNMLDCHTFHVKPGNPGDDPSWERAKQVRDMLMKRAAAFIQDQFGAHSRVHVYVAPTAERYWRGFLRMIKAKPSNRWEVEV